MINYYYYYYYYFFFFFGVIVSSLTKVFINIYTYFCITRSKLVQWRL